MVSLRVAELPWGYFYRKNFLFQNSDLPALLPQAKSGAKKGKTPLLEKILVLTEREAGAYLILTRWQCWLFSSDLGWKSER